MTFSPRFARGLLSFALLFGLLAGLAGPSWFSGHAAPQKQAAVDVVISEFRSRGPGGAGDEFIELYNPTTTALDIGDWELWVSDQTGSDDLLATIPASFVLASGQYYLIANSAAAGYTGLAADTSYNVTNGAIPDNGGVGLYDVDGFIIDAAGMDEGSNYWEGTVLSPLTGDLDQSYERKEGGASDSCVDTDDNFDDFLLRSPNNPTPSQSNPQNAASPKSLCGAPPPTPDPRLPTTTTITSDNRDPSTRGESIVVEFTVAVIAPGTGIPTGIVTVSDGVDSCPETTLVNGSGQCSLRLTTSGTRNLKATYAGDAAFKDSVSSARTHTVAAACVSGHELVINEVAWAGTRASPDDEWIELCNPRNVDVDLTGWRLEGDAPAGSPDPVIELKGVIPAGGYFLLERGDEDTISNIKADQTYQGDLVNTGEALQLFDDQDEFVDSANIQHTANWPAGSTSFARSMERRSGTVDSIGAWITFAYTGNDPKILNGIDATGNTAVQGTPKNINWASVIPPTPTRRPPTKVPTRTPPPQPRPVINEYLPRAGYDWNQDGSVDVFDEFIEISNQGPVDWNMSGWRLDDEEDLGSEPFTLPQITLKPGERAVFYALQTNILLSDGGDSVRLISPSGVIFDAQTYPVVKVADQSHCRLPDTTGTAYPDCFPTPNLTNARRGQIPSLPPGTGLEDPLCRLADTLAEEFRVAECQAFGQNMWSTRYWDKQGWLGDWLVPQNGSKWESFVE